MHYLQLEGKLNYFATKNDKWVKPPQNAKMGHR